MTGAKITLVGLAAGLILALVPTWHTYLAGDPGKDVGYLEEQTVSCGNLFGPKNPHVFGRDDECDAEHTRRGAMAVGVTAAGLLAGGIAFAISRARSYRAAAPPSAERR